MNRLVQSSIRNIVALAIVAVLTVVLFAAGSIVLSSRLVTSDVNKRLQTTAAVSAVVIHGKITDLLALVHSYAEGHSLIADIEGRPGATPVEVILNNLAHALPGTSAAFVASLQGNSLATYPVEPSVIGHNFAYRNWYKGLIATGRPYVSNAIVTQEKGHPLAVTFTDYIRGVGGRPLAILGINYSLESIHAFSTDIGRVQGITLRVTDRVGTSLSAPLGRGLVSLADDPRVRSALVGKSGMSDYAPVLLSGARGPAEVAAYVPVAGAGWAVVASVPNSVAFAGLNDLRESVLLIAGFLVIILLVGTRAILVSERRRHLADRQRRSREHDLAKIIESTEEGFISTDAVGTVTEWNRQAERLFGWTADEVVGKNLIDTVIPPSFRSEYREDIHGFRTGRESQIVGRRVEMTALHRDGHEFPIEVSVWTHEHGGGMSEFVHDISERVATTTALEAARNEAIKASQLKGEFLANMSHEIRTPMNGVLGMSDLLLGTELDVRQRDYAETVHSSAEALMTVINDILDFSKIEAGKLEIESVSFNLRSVVEDSTVLLAATAHQHGLELTCATDVDLPPMLRGDPGRLRQVLLNLLGNAVKFTSEGEVNLATRIVRTESEGPLVVELSVRDTGIGIPAARLRDLFDAFTQAEGSTTRRYGGTGLGLAISRQLVELMGGTLSVVSEPGVGSTFIAAIPFMVDDEATSSPEPTDRFGFDVLIVDDNASSRQLLEDLVTWWGCTATSATGAEQAIALLRGGDHAFDVLILDTTMPDMDGASLARYIRADPTLPDKPTIMLTSSHQVGAVLPGHEPGVVAHVTKPVRMADLHDALSEISRHTGTGSGVHGPASVTAPSPEVPPPSKPRRKGPAPDAGPGHVSTPGAVPTEAITVLLAEDNVVNQRVFVAMLSKMGYGVDVTGNGYELLEALDRFPYPVVFMDCQMPLMDGFQATAQLRLREGLDRHTHVIAVTASAMVDDRDRCLDAGMDDYLAKPFNMDDLAAKLQYWKQEVGASLREEPEASV